MSQVSYSHSDIRACEERAFNAWPALQTILVDGWIFRFADGYTKRANSANAMAPTGAFVSVKTIAESLYIRHGLPTIFRLTPLAGSEPDAVLADAGYEFVDETSVFTLSLTGIESTTANDSAVTIYPVINEVWANGFAAANDVSQTRRATHDRMLASLRVPAAFSVMKENGAPVAYGLAVAERGMVGLFDIVTAPNERRQGYGRRLVSMLLQWGKTQGATTAYLQVTTTNHPATALYEALGFREAYRYHYRVGRAP